MIIGGTPMVRGDWRRLSLPWRQDGRVVANSVPYEQRIYLYNPKGRALKALPLYNQLI
jgi:hypothetical protein